MNASQRTLYHFAIIHTQADMGGLSETVKRSTLESKGLAVWKRKVAAVDTIWTQIERFIEDLRIPYTTVRLYQDGLPVCGREADIVRELAEGASRNHRLLLRLLEKGATIMGTESSELLVEEYKLAKKLLAGMECLESGDSPKSSSEELLVERDRFIARRINSTLLPGETGILFLGMLHSLANLLDEDIRVVSVQPTFAPSEEEK